MKYITLLLLSIFAANTIFAERIALRELPPSAFADTEASTNIAIAALDASRSFSLSLALDAAASWNMLRVTTRGCAPPQESLEVRNSPDGTQLIMR